MLTSNFNEHRNAVAALAEFIDVPADIVTAMQVADDLKAARERHRLRKLPPLNHVVAELANAEDRHAAIDAVMADVVGDSTRDERTSLLTKLMGNAEVRAARLVHVEAQELVKLAQAPHGAMVAELAKLVTSHPDATTMDAHGALNAPESDRKAFVRVTELVGRIEALETAVTAIRPELREQEHQVHAAWLVWRNFERHFEDMSQRVMVNGWLQPRWLSIPEGIARGLTRWLPTTAEFAAVVAQRVVAVGEAQHARKVGAGLAGL